MSILGTLLDLPDWSRLTGVEVTPLIDHLPHGGLIVINVVALPGWVDGEDVCSAVTPYVEWEIAGCHGNSPDGSTWFATLQYAPAVDNHEAAADSATEVVRRATACSASTLPRSRMALH